MQHNPALANSVQSNYMNSFSGSVLQNLPGADLTRQLGMSAPQIPQANNLQFNSPRLPPQQAQQLDQLPKLQSTMNPLGSIMQPPQQLNDVTQQQRQNMVNQGQSSSQVQAQILQPQTLVQPSNNMLQQQTSIQNNQLQRNLTQNLQQQPQIMSQSQQQNMIQSQLPDQINQQLQHISDNQLQLLQKLQQQQQSILAQQSSQQLPTQLPQIQDQQRQLIDVSQSFSRSSTSSQILDMPQIVTNSHLSQPNTIAQQIAKNNISQPNTRFSQTPPQPKLQQQQPGMQPEMAGHMGISANPLTNVVPGGSNIVAGAVGAGQSGITEDIPSCSTSPSTNNCSNVVQPVMNNRVHRSAVMSEDMAQSTATILCPSGLETISTVNLVKDFPQKSEVKPSLNIPRSQSQGVFTPHTYMNGAPTHTDYLDTSSSTTSVCISQNDMNLQHNNNPLPFNPQSMLFREASQDGEVHADQRNNVSFGNNIDGHLGVPLNPDPLLTKGLVGLGKDYPNNLSSGGMIGDYDNSKDAQQELSSSMVSQSFGVPDMAFNSIDSTINDGSFLNRGAWAPAQQYQRMRTYTKV